jgi:pimeloyl-ACP methyl ester carboxylesterase
MWPFKDANFDDPKVRERFEELMPGVDLDDPEVQTYLREEVTLPMAVVHKVLRLGAAAYRLAHSLSIPTLVIQGRDDELVRPGLTRKLVRRLGTDYVTYQEVPGGHELIQDGSEHKAEVLGLIIDYLREGP